MMLKPGVDQDNVHPVLWTYLGAIATRHRIVTSLELIVTSLRRPPGPRASLHSPPAPHPCRAADLRRWALDNQRMAAAFAKDLQRMYGRELGVVLEPEWLTPLEVAARGGLSAIDPHLHVELKGASECALL
jgi:hypothetical protein